MVPRGATAPIFRSHPPESWESGNLRRIFKIEISLPVPFALQGKHRIRTRLDTAGDPAREVNSQKWKARIGDRVNQVPHELPPVGHDFVILTTKRHDLQPLRISSEPHDTVAM